MLKRLVLRDFVIVHELDIELGAGFTVLTGETGAGKSILIDALQLALGERADSGAIREGATRTEVSAEFDAPPAVRAWLDGAGFEAGAQLLLRRSVDTQGRSRGWVNGSPATAVQLRELGAQLLDIHGQHAWQSLTRAEAVRGLLDAYAGVPWHALDEPWRQWREAGQRLEQARAAQDGLQRERERLLWQIGELDKLAPGATEWDELNAEHTRLSHAQALLDAAAAAMQAVEDDDTGALQALGRAEQQLREQAHLEPEFAAMQEALASSLASAEDALHSLRQYLRKNEPDPQRLAELDERVSLWLSLARRYHRQAQELPALLAGWKQELAALDASADLAGLQAAEQEKKRLYMDAAGKLTARRRKAAPKLAASITQAMQGLGMAGGRFEVQLQANPEPTAFGMESAVFLVSGHAGSTPRPIGKVASGGELSRIALAIAVTTSQLGNAPTLIFDEVDSGIGGAVAEVVGRLMKQLGRDRQVMAVTHLPQVAACADQHLVVSKHSGAAGVSSQVAPVQGEQRVAEVARMLGGERLSGTTLAHAKEMLGPGN